MDIWFEALKKRIPATVRAAVLAAFFTGLLVHLPAMVRDIPNHDGLGSMYFDQNMVTSGRWFLMIACGISSYFTVPWVIGLLGLCFLSLTAGLLADLTGVKERTSGALIGALLAAFPALASTFAYVFTLDGYMLGLLLAVWAVWWVPKKKAGPVIGAVCLAFSLGTYQAYLSFAIVLCLYRLLIAFAETDAFPSPKQKLGLALRYAGMGAGGAVLYYVLLRILLAIQGKELDTYQGISGIEGGRGLGSMLQSLPGIYRDFLHFTLKGKILAPNGFAALALGILLALTLYVIVRNAARKGLLKKPLFYVSAVLACVLLPLSMNVILLITPSVNYHLIMRYVWILLPVLAVGYLGSRPEGEGPFFGEKSLLPGMVLTIAAAVLIFCYGLADNIGYSNLQKKYEKTYAYCLRLLDRIEQTPGYEQGMPVAIIGVVGDESFPLTDLTGDVTENMIGLNGDYLVYTGANYEAFFRNYLGATLNFLPVEDVTEIYYSDVYRQMDSFPGPDSVRVVDGILYVKTENKW